MVDRLSDTVSTLHIFIEFFSEKYDSVLSLVVGNGRAVKALKLKLALFEKQFQIRVY